MSGSDSDSTISEGFDLDSMPTKATPKSDPMSPMMIAVIGTTGVDKSQFIQTLTRDDSVVVGDNTFDVNPVRCFHPESGKEVIFLDTPGFGQFTITGRTDSDILSTIVDWLKVMLMSEQGIAFAGILYLHRISDNRVTNVSAVKLETLQELYGKDSLPNVIFVTTMWKREDKVFADTRQAQLKRELEASKITLDTQVAHFGNTRTDGWSIIDKFKFGTPRVPGLQDTTRKSESEFLKSAMIIAVMGATGAGKSQFIRTLTGDNSVVVGHDLESETVDVNPVGCLHSTTGKDVVLLDTPGFADTNRTDTEILFAISNWFNETYADGIKLAGILYLHRISDNRVTNISVTNLKMLRQLCGTESLKNVIFVTTMWGKEDTVRAERRQAQLEQSYWKDMVDLGAQVARFGDTRRDGWSIIDKLESKAPCILKIQKEMVDQGKRLADTAAGGEVEKQLNEMREEHERKEKELKARAEEARKEGEAAKKSADERAKRAEAEKKRAEEAAKRAQIDSERANAAALAKVELAKKEMEKAAKDTKEAMDKEQKKWFEEQRKIAEADKKRAEEEAKRVRDTSEKSNAAALARFESATKRAKEAEELANARRAAMEKEQTMWRDEQRKAEEAAQRAKRELEELNNEGGFWNGLGKVCIAVGKALP